jgi:uncharacterized repeat protein (TIGR03803 family)
LVGVYFKGNAPSLGSDVFYLDGSATVYYLPGTTGWGSTFGGLPTALWQPPPPGAWTLSASTITTTGATLNGTVNPNGSLTAAWFQWGTTTNYGNLTPATGMGSGTNALPLSAPLAGLTPGVTYHYRVAATNSNGAGYGSDGSFTTLALPAVGPAQTYTVLKSFTGSDGGWPSAGLVVAGSTLYGTTWWGGNSTVFERGLGVVFELNTDGSGYTVLKAFNGSDGDEPGAGLVLAGSTLYGTAADGGSPLGGVVFKVNTDGTGYAVLKNFSGSDGMSPVGGLVLSGSTLYGTTEYGGSSDYGVVFRLNTDGSGYAVLKSFTGSDGEHPVAGLVLSGSTLYGTTAYGGSSYSPTDDGYGVVFKVNTDGSGYAVLKSFSGSDGRTPFAGLVLAGRTLYGTTEYGGSPYNPPNNYGNGVVFKVNTDGTDYTVLKSFSGSDGANPVTADLRLSGATLYGTTAYGGSSGSGVIFKVNTDGTDYTVLKSFGGSDGMTPFAGLVFAGGTLYGTTFYGGSLGKGVVFCLAFLSITGSPLTQTAEAGSTVGFRVKAEPPVPGLAYQWFFGGTHALVGATNALLELTDVQFSQSGAYTVVITNVAGAVTSAPAMLNVIASVERRPVPDVKVTAQPGSVLNLDDADALSPAPNWTPLGSVSLTTTSQYYFDLTLPLPPQRFYRAWQTGAPDVRPSLDLHLVPAITLTGSIGGSVRVDAINQFGPIDAWFTLDTVTLTNTSQLYFDVSAPGQPQRLYRLVPSP